MSTSIHGGRLLTGRPWDANAALDAGFARDVVHNNLAHFADQSAQVHICWAATGPGINAATTYFVASESTYLSFGPFPLRLRQDGRSYKLRIRIAGATTGGDYSVRFFAVIAPAGEAQQHLVAADSVYQTGVAAGGAAWLTGASIGPNAYPTMIEIPASLTSQWVATTSTLDNVGGDPVGVEQCLVSLNIRASLTWLGGGSSIPQARLHGVYLAEYIGDD